MLVIIGFNFAKTAVTQCVTQPLYARRPAVYTILLFQVSTGILAKQGQYYKPVICNLVEYYDSEALLGYSLYFFLENHFLHYFDRDFSK